MSQYTRREMLRLSVAGALGAACSASTNTLGENIKSSLPSLRTRMFWTWDHSTEWALNRPGAQTLGASNSYGRPTDAFIEDYTRLFNWCGKHHVDAVVVWGLLRDSHGGLESAKKLCDIAAQNNVRLLCGVGLNAYGGVYYEGDSAYSLERHLEKNPDFYGLDATGKKMVFNFGVLGPRLSHHACPSRKENQDFATESLQWLFKNLPNLGGVQIETGDTGVCVCAKCKARRQHPAGSMSWEDMAMMYPLAADSIRSIAPKAWIVCETYTHPEPHTNPKEQGGFGEGKPDWADACIAKFPKDVFVQWVCDHYVKPKSRLTWTKAGAVSSKERRNVMRAHFGTYWGRYRKELAADWIADMAQNSMTAGFDAISIFGEVSPFETGAELNYLALEDFGSAKNPKADLEMFLNTTAAPLLGGKEQARKYLRYARLVEEQDKLPDALKDIYAECAKHPPEVARRWVWLGNFLSSFVAS